MKTTEWKHKQFSVGGKHKCWRCGCHLTFEIATVDHLRPKSRGGPDRAYNYRLACYRCNSGRGDRPLTKYEKWLAYGRQAKGGQEVRA